MVGRFGSNPVSLVVVLVACCICGDGVCGRSRGRQTNGIIVAAVNKIEKRNEKTIPSVKEGEQPSSVNRLTMLFNIYYTVSDLRNEKPCVETLEKYKRS